ncbi:MAG: Mov34/MPN/PAD-1 family protein [Byssovorax sp.]
MSETNEASDVHAWIRGGLTLTAATVAAVDEDAIAAYGRDEEACGYLCGPAAEPLVCDAHTSMPNRANKLHALDPVRYFRTGRTYFDLDTRKLERAVEAGAASGRPVKVLYHSHLDAGAYFSPTDRAAMSMGKLPETEGGAIEIGPGPAWPLAFLVVSVREGKVDDRRLFIWDAAARDFVPAPFTIAA